MSPNFNISSYTAAISGIAVVLALDILVVVGRLYVRKMLRQALKLNDWLVIPALLLNIGMAVALFVGFQKDVLFSRTVKQLPGPQLRGKILAAYETIKKIEFAVLLMSFTSLALIKVSFLLFYKGVFVYDKWRLFDLRNIIIHFMIAIVLIWDIGFTFTLIFACRSDFRAHWSTTTSKELTTKCINTFLMMYALSISDFITDAIILLIPIPMIWKLRLPLKRKFGVFIVFFLGSLATLASLIRLLWMRKIISVGATPSKHQDPLTLLSNELFWYIIESEIALLAVCLPALSRFRRTQLVDSIIRSIQSKWSLKSAESAGERDSNHAGNSETPSSSNSAMEDSRQTKGGTERIGILPDVESQPHKEWGSAEPGSVTPTKPVLNELAHLRD